MAISIKLGYLLGLYVVAGLFFILYTQTNSQNYLWFTIATMALSTLLYVFAPGGGNSEAQLG